MEAISCLLRKLLMFVRDSKTGKSEKKMSENRREAVNMWFC